MQKRIHWTPQERATVLQRALVYMHEGRYTEFEALKRAQEYALCTSRQRNFASHSAAVAEIHELKKMMALGLKPTKVEESPIVENPPPPAPPDAQPVPPALSIDDLVASIAQMIATKIVDAVKVAVKELEHSYSLQKHNPGYDANHVDKKRVVIIGLLNDQAHAITREFSADFDVKCIDTDRAMGMAPPDADAYLLMKNFINHPLYHKYRVFSNHVLIDGGMSTLRMWFNTKGKEL